MSMMIAAGLALLIQAAPSPIDLADARCVGALLALSEQTNDVTDKAGVDSMMMFYMGKIVGRSGAAKVKPALTAAAKAMTDDAVAVMKLAENCADEAETAIGER